MKANYLANERNKTEDYMSNYILKWIRLWVVPQIVRNSNWLSNPVIFNSHSINNILLVI